MEQMSLASYIVHGGVTKKVKHNLETKEQQPGFD